MVKRINIRNRGREKIIRRRGRKRLRRIFFALSEEEQELILNLRRKNKIQEQKRDEEEKIEAEAMERKKLERNKKYRQEPTQTVKALVGLDPLSKNSNDPTEKMEGSKENSNTPMGNPINDEKNNSDVRKMMRARVKRKKQIEREKIKKEKLEYDFLHKEALIEDVCIARENMTDEQQRQIQNQQDILSNWIQSAIRALRQEQKKVVHIMEKLANDQLKKIEKEYEENQKDFSPKMKKKELKMFIRKGSNYGGPIYADDYGGLSPLVIVTKIVNKSSLKQDLPANMTTETAYEQLEKPTKENIWLISEYGRRTLNFLRESLTNARIHHLDYFYNGTYEQLPNCWLTIGLLNSTIKYLFGIKSGFSDGSTKIILPK